MFQTNSLKNVGGVGFLVNDTLAKWGFEIWPFYSSVLNHSTLEFRDFSKRVPAVENEIILDRRIFER